MEKSFFNNYNKKYILLFPISILIGTIFANLCGIKRVSNWEIFSIEYITKFSTVKITYIKLFEYIFQKRIRLLALILLSCYTTIKDKIALAMCSCFGIFTGIVIAALTMQYGIKYFPVFFCGVLCHMFIYGLGICIIYKIFIADRATHHITTKKKYIIVFIGVIIYLIGIIMETFMNNIILPKVFQLYF